MQSKFWIWLLKKKMGVLKMNKIKYVNEIERKLNGDDLLNVLDTMIFLQENFLKQFNRLDNRTRTELVNEVNERIDKYVDTLNENMDNNNYIKEKEYFEYEEGLENNGYEIALDVLEEMSLITREEKWNLFIESI